jgi:molybdate transport system substrate-binding protein
MLLRQLLLIYILSTITVPALAISKAQPIVVFAGSASQPPLEEAAEAFQTETGIPVILHLGGSGSMLSQILLTGQGDIYIPGSPDYMEKAVKHNLTASPPSVIAYLVPALIVAKGNPRLIRSLNDLKSKDLRIGLADPEGVCVGLYAVELLEFNGLLDALRSRMTGMVESCAKVASMVPLHLADVVLGWREFEAWNPEVMEAVLLKPNEIPRLAYIPASVLRNAANPTGADAFITYLTSPKGQAIFQKWGYLTDEIDARQFAPYARVGGTYILPENW